MREEEDSDSHQLVRFSSSKRLLCFVFIFWDGSSGFGLMDKGWGVARAGMLSFLVRAFCSKVMNKSPRQ